MSTWPFKKVQLQTPLERLACSVPLPRSWQGAWQTGVEVRVEAALIRLNETWDAARFEKKMQSVVELFPLLRATLSPAHQSIAIRENQAVRWRLLDHADILQQVLNKGWTPEADAQLSIDVRNGALWEVLVALPDEGGFLVCIAAHPAIADAGMLHAALAYLEAQFKNQAPSPTQREILARERLEILNRTAWSSVQTQTATLPAFFPATLAQKSQDPSPAGSCSFRLPAHSWQKLSNHARSVGLPSFAVAALLMRAALQKLIGDDIGPVLIKNNLRLPKSAAVGSLSGWDALQVNCRADDNFLNLTETAAKNGWQPMPYSAETPWPQGLWVGIGLLPASSETQQLRVLSSDPGPTQLLWLCPDGDGETFLTWTGGDWDAEFPLSLAALLKELAGMWSEFAEQPLRALPTNSIVLPLWQRWNSSYQPYQLEQTLQQLLGPALQKAGDRVAIRSRAGELTYRQLDIQSRQLAQLLRSHSIGQGDLFGISLPRTPSMLVAMLGILRAGAGYVPLDPLFPAERLQYMLKDAKVKGCFCEEAMIPIIEGCTSPWIWNEVQRKLPEYMADQWQDPSQDPSSIAYVIYTSGSTGQPKGVMLGHRSVVNFLLSMQEAPGIDANDRVLAITTLSFDIAVLELLLPLLAGASLYLVNAEEGKDGKLLRQIIEEEGITIFQATPSNFRLLLDAGWQGSKIRKALCGGEAFPVDVARRLLPIVPEVWNMYGPTETTVWSTIHRLQKADGLVPIGRPIANTAVYILDENLTPVLPGEKGEIWIGGSGLALGYLGRTDLTLERFQMIPAVAALAYRTGDIGRFLWNGGLEIYGRADHQVKLRGYRMELGEVEAVIASLPGIEQCLSAVKEFGPDDPRLVAYITTRGEFQERQIRQLLKDKLPNYMLPSHYLVLDKMPLLPNGKMDRKQLPHPLEKVAVPPVAPPVSEPVRSAAASATLPMTPSQTRMLFTEELDPDSTVHNLVGAWVINGAMDFQAFRRALEVLIIEQDSLRMAAVATDEGYVLQLSPPFAPELRIHGRERPNMSLEEVQAAILNLGREKIDPTQVPNFRTGIFRVNTEITVFFLITHHIFWDGFSYGVLWKNIQRLYKEVLVVGRALPKPPAFNFSQYALRRQEEMRAPHIREELKYWLKVYQDLPEPLELAYDFNRPAQLKHRASTAWVAWDGPLDSKLQHVAKTLNASVFHVVLAAYYALLQRISNQNDLVIGTPVHGRQQIEVFELLGNFINVVALRQKLDPGMSFVQLIEQVKSSTNDAMARSDLPFENLVAELKLARDPGRTPLYNTMLFFQDQSLQKIQFGATIVEDMRLPNPTVDTDLILWVERHAQKTFAGFNFRVDLWEQGTIDNLALSFRQILDALLANPEQTIQEPPLVSKAQEEILHSWNASTLKNAPDQTLPAILDKQAQAAPQRIAVQDLNGQVMTWQELDKRSRQLAQRLRQKGVRRGAIVGICHGRKLDLIVGLLAILRSGASYLPLDPMFPADRLNFMIEDAQAKLIITESAHLDLLAGTPVPLLCLDKDRESWNQLDPARDQGPFPEPEDLAYIIYTSGSTGKPKGVEIQHQAVACFLQAFRSAVDMPAEPRTLAITTISFDISVLEIFGTLAWGGTITLVDQEKLVDGPGLIKALQDHQINLLQATPATWRLLLESRWFGQKELTALCGGEALPRNLARELVPRIKALWNVYGPTEATVWATVSRITDPDAAITIGRVLPQYEAYILDEQKRLLPPGVIGSLYLGGPALARAYRQRPDLTAEKFIPHPFKADARIYDTGDLCRYRADGQLEYLSRKDNQIKLRGYRIELGEIENAMSMLPEIKQAVVVVREDQVGDQRLVAYAVCQNGKTVSLNNLHQSLRRSLPAYMLPNHLILLPQFSLTASGKIDKKALPAPQAEDVTPSQSNMPMSPQEERIAAIWREMIGVKKVRPTDNFFNLGGHSLLALKVLHRCQQELGASFKVRDLLLMNLNQLATLLPAIEPSRAKGSGHER